MGVLHRAPGRAEHQVADAVEHAVVPVRVQVRGHHRVHPVCAEQFMHRLPVGPVRPERLVEEHGNGPRVPVSLQVGAQPGLLGRGQLRQEDVAPARVGVQVFLGVQEDAVDAVHIEAAVEVR